MKNIYALAWAAMAISLVTSCGSSSGSGGSSALGQTATTLQETSFTHPTDIYYSSAPYATVTMELSAVGGNAPTSNPLYVYEDGVQIQQINIANVQPGESREVQFTIWNTRSEASTYPGPWIEQHTYRVRIPGVADETFTVNFIVRMVSNG